MIQKKHQLPFVRIITGILLVLLVPAIAQLIVLLIGDSLGLAPDIRDGLSGIMITGLLITAYIVVYRRAEERKIYEFKLKGSAKFIFIGLVVGFGLQLLNLSIVFMLGSVQLGPNLISFSFSIFFVLLSSTIIEEILFRGVLLRITEERLGSFAALLISSVLFGSIHLLNPGANIKYAIIIAIQGGLILGSAYIFARNLWLPIAVHFAWNYSQSMIFGIEGTLLESYTPIFSTELSGSNWITGGALGLEGSVQATLFCIVASIILLYLSKKTKDSKWLKFKGNNR